MAYILCPNCGDARSRVIDHRANAKKNQIRRRRQCAGCGHRYTTYETVAESYRGKIPHETMGVYHQEG